MKVFKFGGASVNSIERIQNLASILKEFPGEKIMAVISAMGKTTNALEKVVEAFYNGNRDLAFQLLQQIKHQHAGVAKELLSINYISCEAKLIELFAKAESLINEKAVRSFDHYYDQIVCIGELLSTSIISAYLQEAGIPNHWLDVRDFFLTDNNFRDANIDWNTSQSRVKENIVPLFQNSDIVLTQGFIGATKEKESTTLGREGSDYTAAVFANMLDAEQVFIWKDVEAVMNADPKQFPDARPISELNYNEVIEMAYYGAQVIHPKTIKPLQNKNIPLHVKCFLKPELPGTFIHNRSLNTLPAIIVLKEKQLMLQFSTKDFSFIGEHNLIMLYRIFEQLKIRPNLTQNAAISFTAVLDDRPDKIESLVNEASVFFDVQAMKGLSLLTIRHYNDKLFEKLTEGKNILLHQQTPVTVQVLMSEG